MNNEYYKNAYNELVKHTKLLLDDRGEDYDLAAWVSENNQKTLIRSIHYLGYGLAALTTYHGESLVVSLQALQVHFEYVSKQRKIVERSFEIFALDPRIEA